MIKELLTLATTLLPLQAFSSTLAEASLEDLACGADHVLIGSVVGVDMIDEDGHPVIDEKATTGPGLTNTIRLIIEVVEVLETNADAVPTRLRVPLDPFMHYSLGQIKRAHRERSPPSLVFLEGDKFQPVIDGRFRWTLSAKEQALEIRSKCEN